MEVLTDKEKIFDEIDELIDKIDCYKNNPFFTIEKERRQFNVVSALPNDNEILKVLSCLIAFSQNANSEAVEQVIKSGKLDLAFSNFDIDKVVLLNPCDIVDSHWSSIKGIRQQAKLFHIVSLARKIRAIGSFKEILNQTKIPTSIKTHQDIEDFWLGFDILLNELKKEKIPFFRSTTSLLHFLLEIGYDCVKPDLIVMRVAKKLRIIDSEVGDKNLRKVVRFIQEYSVEKKIRPSVIDFYFLIDEGQKGAVKFVKPEFYKN